MTQDECVQLDHVLQMYHLGYHKGHRPSSIRDPPVESATSTTSQHWGGDAQPASEGGTLPSGRCRSHKRINTADLEQGSRETDSGVASQSSGRRPPDSLLETATPVGRARKERKGNGLPSWRKRVCAADLAVPRPDRGRGRRDSLLGTATPVGRARVEGSDERQPGMRKRVTPADPAVRRPDSERGRPDSILGTATPAGRARVERKGNGLPGWRKRVSPADAAVPSHDRGRGPGPAMGIWPSSILASTSTRPHLLADLMGSRNTLAIPWRQRECTSEDRPSEYGMHMR